MSYIPDIRNPIEEPLYKNTKGGQEEVNTENDYYQGILSEEDANYLAGFDYAVEDVLEGFLFNLEMYLDDLEECGFDDIRLGNFDRHFKEFIEKERSGEPLDLDTIKDTQIRLIFTLFRKFHNYAEMSRDEMGTSMIDSMSDEQYEECKKKYKDGYKNALLRLEESRLNKDSGQ